MRMNINLSPELAKRVRNISIREQIPQATVLRRALNSHFNMVEKSGRAAMARNPPKPQKSHPALLPDNHPNQGKSEMYKNMGRQAKDNITGFSGTVTAFSQYISGCNRILLTSKSIAGKEAADAWFDEQRLTFSGKAITLDNGATPGFGPEAPKH
jgi:hypothetical protein